MAERPKSLNLYSSQLRLPTVDEPEVTDVADVGTARRLMPGVSEQNELNAPAPAARCTLKVSDVPGDKPRAEVMNRRRYDPAAGRSQTPDSGVAVSMVDQRSAAVQPPPSVINPDVMMKDSPSGVEYRIAQTPTKSTIVIIRNDSSLPRAGTPPVRTTTSKTSSPVGDDQTPVTVPPPSAVVQPIAVQPIAVQPVAIQPVAVTESTSVCRPPVNVSNCPSKFLVTDTMVTAMAPSTPSGPAFRSFPSAPSDERTPVRLNRMENEHRRYVIAAGTLPTVELTATKLLPPTVNFDEAVSESVEHRSTEVPTTSPSRRRNDVEVGVGSRQAVISPLDPAPPPADRTIALSGHHKVSIPAVIPPPVQTPAPANGITALPKPKVSPPTVIPPPVDTAPANRINKSSKPKVSPPAVIPPPVDTAPANRINKSSKPKVSTPAVIHPSVDPSQTSAPVATRIIKSSKPKVSTPAGKHRDLKSIAAAKQKRASVIAKGQPGQRTKQSHIIAKPDKLAHSKRQDDSLEQTSAEDSQPVKRSVAELRSVFQ